MSRSIECPKCGTRNKPGTVCECVGGSRSVSGSAVWLTADTAPKDGITPILGDFGWPWACFAIWDQYDEHWCIATIQASPMTDGPNNTWLETDTEKHSSLKRWVPVALLPNAEDQ